MSNGPRRCVDQSLFSTSFSPLMISQAQGWRTDSIFTAVFLSSARLLRSPYEHLISLLRSLKEYGTNCNSTLQICVQSTIDRLTLLKKRARLLRKQHGSLLAYCCLCIKVL